MADFSFADDVELQKLNAQVVSWPHVQTYYDGRITKSFSRTA